MFRSIEPQVGMSGLAAHRHRVTLRGGADGLRFPRICAHCGGAAAGALKCQKVFQRADGESVQYVIKALHVPFCGPCIARHGEQQQETRLSSMDLVRRSFASMQMLGVVCLGLGAAFGLPRAPMDALQGHVLRGVVEFAIACVFALLAWLQGRAVWEQTERLRVPAQTHVARAFDFSDDAPVNSGSRHIVCAIRNERFAQAFETLNSRRESAPRSTVVTGRRSAAVMSTLRQAWSALGKSAVRLFRREPIQAT